MKKLTDDQKFNLIAKISLVGGAIGVWLFLSLLTSCSIVHKVFHKEMHKSDSSVVIHQDSSNVHKQESNENILNLSDVELKVEYIDTAEYNIEPEHMPIYNPDDYFATPSGKMLSDVIKSVRQAGKVKSITIKAGKVDNITRQVTTSDSGHVTTDKKVEVKKNNTVVDKKVKRVTLWWWLILVVIAAGAIYYFRHSIWAQALKLFTPLI